MAEATLRDYVQHKSTCKLLTPNLCVCGCPETKHEQIWDGEEQKRFGFCHGCARAGRKYPATHHDYTLGTTMTCTCGLDAVVAASWSMSDGGGVSGGKKR